MKMDESKQELSTLEPITCKVKSDHLSRGLCSDGVHLVTPRPVKVDESADDVVETVQLRITNQHPFVWVSPVDFVDGQQFCHVSSFVR